MPNQTRLREQKLKRKNSRRLAWGQKTPWVLGLGSFSLMLLWHWKLLLTTGSGISVMALVYLMQQGTWQHYWQEWLQGWRGANRQLAVAAGSGAIASISCYLAIAIYLNSADPWSTTGKLIQGGSTVGIFFLLLWQMLHAKNSSSSRPDQESKYQRALNNLSAPEPLKRLIALQQLTSLALNQELSSLQHSQGADCIRLLFSLEVEPAVREAGLTALQSLDTPPQLQQPLLNLPLQPEKRLLRIEP